MRHNVGVRTESEQQILDCGTVVVSHLLSVQNINPLSQQKHAKTQLLRIYCARSTPLTAAVRTGAKNH